MIRYGVDSFRGFRGRLRYWLSARDVYGSMALMMSAAYVLGITPFLLLILGVYFVGVFRLLVSLDVTPSFCVCMTFFLQHSVVSIAICLFCVIAFSFERRLSIINQVLKNLSHQWDSRTLKAVTQKQRSLQCLDSFSMYTIVTKDPAEIIQESMEIHQLICEAAATANKYFTYQLLTIISIAFLIIGSNRAIKKSEKTGGIVHSLLNKTKSAEVKEKLQQFSMQLMHLKINFTAAGLFNIDRTLYFTHLRIVHFLFFVLCFGISVKEGDSIIGYFFQTNITRFSDGTLRLTGILAMSTIFGFAMFKRQRLVGIIQNNIVVDEIFVRLGMNFLISLGMLLFNVIYLCVSYSLLVSATISPSFVTFTAFALPHINISLMVFKFLCTTDLARSRFSMLNEILQDILDAHIEQHSALELSPMHSVVNHRRYSHRLRNLISTPMKRYSVTSVIRLNPEYAIKQVSNIHNLLCDISMLNPKRLDRFEADEFFAFFLMQLIWYIVIIVLIVEASSRTIMHSNYTAAIVHKILNITDDPELRDRLFRLSLQLSHRKITGAATCYLIILIQFRFTHHMDETGSNSTNHSHSHLGD
ncbi:hypothetical protein M5D96_003335 [Drosophila gunungcola]|uniref:Gustatory receptor n=1 Tax=Drosophila gunungcola TaxID=103775 RepID=A0A9Q0BS98_9MUSC|nr:hypothetical protein M5D96_003335 [Drosophila gunungcola]